MALALDHIVIAVNDLAQTITDYRSLGFHVVPGGEHPGRPTHNALVVFADGSYFELIAWRSPAPGDRWWELLTQQGEGIVDFALLPPDTVQTVAAARSRRLDYGPPQDGGRLRPDGEQLRWRNARPLTPDLPFLCGDLTPRALRVPEGDVRRHPNGARGVARLDLAVSDLDASLQRYRALLGDTPAARFSEPTVAPGTGHRQAHVTLGSSTLLLTEVSPGRSAADASDAAGIRHAARGEGPYALALFTDAPATAAPSAALAHGAAITWVND